MFGVNDHGIALDHSHKFHIDTFRPQKTLKRGLLFSPHRDNHTTLGFPEQPGILAYLRVGANLET